MMPFLIAPGGVEKAEVNLGMPLYLLIESDA
jgi:hypothetical protein